MVDHVKPLIRNKPDHIIFHAETNDILADKMKEILQNYKVTHFNIELCFQLLCEIMFLTE